MTARIAYCNGCWMPLAEATVSTADRGFTLGDGLFETLLVLGGRPRLVEAHLARLQQGAQTLAIALPHTLDALADLLQEAVERNHLDTGSLRLTLTRGVASRGLWPADLGQPTLVIVPGPGQPHFEPLSVVVARSTCRNERSPLSRIKSLNYLDGILARREALERGAEEAVLLNTCGQLTEAAIANLFLQRDGEWLTPPLTDGVLPGVMRGQMLARGLAREARLTPADVACAEAALLTSSLSLRPVRTWEGRSLPRVPDADWCRMLFHRLLEKPEANL